MKAGLCTCVFGVLGVAVLVQSIAVPRSSYADKTKLHNLRAKRSEMGNAINPMPRMHEIQPEGDSNIGDELMEEFLTFLTLKETGLLDACLFKK